MPRTRSCARCLMSSRLYSGRNSSDPKPKPAAPAASHPGICSARYTAHRKYSDFLGQDACTTPANAAGRNCSPETILTAVAPARSGAKGLGGGGDSRHDSHAELRRRADDLWHRNSARRSSRPPAAWVRRTSWPVSTVPAPTRQSAGRAPAKAAMLAKGCGELSGTSMTRKPAAYKTLATSMTCSGTTPRKYSRPAHVGGGSDSDGMRFYPRCDVLVHAVKTRERGGSAIQLLCIAGLDVGARRRKAASIAAPRSDARSLCRRIAQTTAMRR